MKVEMNVDVRQKFQRFLASNVSFVLCSICPFQDLPVQQWVPTFSDWASQLLSSFPTSSSLSGFSQMISDLNKSRRCPSKHLQYSLPIAMSYWTNGVSEDQLATWIPTLLAVAAYAVCMAKKMYREKKRKDISQMSWGQIHKPRKHFKIVHRPVK